MRDPNGLPVAMTWRRAATLDDIPALGARVVEIDRRRIALFRTSDDRLFALHDRCPHRGGPLSQGIVHGTCVTCPLHDWVIDLATGEATGPDEGIAATFPVRLEDEVVLIGVPVDSRPDRAPLPDGRAETRRSPPAKKQAAAVR